MSDLTIYSLKDFPALRKAGRTAAEVLDYIRNRGWKQKMLLWNDFFTSIV